MEFHNTHLFVTFLIVTVFLCVSIDATNPREKPEPPIHPKPPVVVLPPTHQQNCPAPNPELLRCLKQWACQYLIRLDLRCLLNLNGNPLLGGILGGEGGGTGPGLLGGLLG